MTQQEGRGSDWNDGRFESTRSESGRDSRERSRPTSGKGIILGLVGALVGVIAVAVLALGGVPLPGGGDESTPSASEATTSEITSPAPEPTGAPGTSETTTPAAPASPTSSTGPSAPTSSPAPRPWSASDAAPDGGTYTGVVTQRGTQRTDTDYEVTMTFTSAGSRVSYPTLGCTGTLQPTGDVDGTRVYRETITSGTCDRGGTWYVTRQDTNAVSAEYRPATGDYTVQGQLTR
jgi:hypothetical protein